MESSKITVYSFDVFDTEGRSYMPFKATREDIAHRYRGTVIEGTGEQVPLLALDKEGRYRRWPEGWGEQHLERIA
ncbi:hypothetical protein [Azohydromonas caseinilytica]|uniref:Uncharacterized protein n=1 Tax=Azohydromonas caseinilytica TaxID=2728836 RepID=A0A848FER7_9BURK|nr:hypothetical protein [Azohydromonas caseinilytica]NML17782.1 hypothetical protein [Azohydromonas caseinilytica]